jgi:hypothetical protein
MGYFIEMILLIPFFTVFIDSILSPPCCHLTFCSVRHLLHVFTLIFVFFSIPYIMRQLQKHVYGYKHIYSFSN